MDYSTLLKPKISKYTFMFITIPNSWNYKSELKSSDVGIVYIHWPETREFITQTIELWNRCIRLSCYYNRPQNTCPLYTHVSPFLQCVGPFNLFQSVWTMFVYNKGGWTICWWKFVFKTPSTVFKSSKWNCYTFRVDALDISFVRDWHRGSRVLPLFFEILIHSFLCFVVFLHSYRHILCLKPFPFQSSQVILVKLATHTLYYI